MGNEAKLLLASLSSCAERIRSLGYSLTKNQSIFPLDITTLERLSEDQKESVDAWILRYSQCVSLIQDQLIKGVLIAEQEDIVGKSNRDKGLLAEKFGAIKSAEDFSVAAVLRNKFAHFYPEQGRDQLAKLNTLVEESLYVMEVFASLSQYISEKGFLSNQ